MLPNDPEMLYSYINMQLRDNYSSLDEMCQRLDESRGDIEDRLKSAGYQYDADSNRFIPASKPGGIV